MGSACQLVEKEIKAFEIEIQKAADWDINETSLFCSGIN